jgi:hypothetical protein
MGRGKNTIRDRDGASRELPKQIRPESAALRNILKERGEKMASWRMDDYAKGSVACVVSLGLGTILTFAPRRGVALVGWESYPRLARAFGAADLLVGTGLLLNRRRSRWMFLRAYLDAAVAVVYALILAEGGARRTRSIGMMGLMSVLAVLVYLTAWRLRDAENAQR